MKPLEEFCASSRRPSGRGSYCKPCFNLRCRDSRDRKRFNDGKPPTQRLPPLPEGIKMCPDCGRIKPVGEFPRTGSKRHSYCKPCHNARTTETYTRLYGGTRHYHLRRRYGIGVGEFDAMVAAQGGLCAICGADQPEHVDHDHRTGRVRGILCFNCNGGLGQFRDQPHVLRRAVDYLERTTPCYVLVHPGVTEIRQPDPRPVRTVTADPDAVGRLFTHLRTAVSRG